MPWYRSMFVSTMLIVCLLGILPGITTAADADQKPLKVFVDTKQISFQIEPQIINGTTLVQFRPLFEAMGMEVKWDEANRLVTGSKSGLTLSLHIGDLEATVNGKKVELSQSAQIMNGSTMVPLRFIGESSDAIVHWDPVNREITVITSDLLKSLGITKQEAQRRLDDYAAKQPKQTDPSTDGTVAAPTPQEPGQAPPTSPPKSTAQAGTPVDLSALQGMYYGFRDDFGGYECGGACWDIYSFLPDNRILVGAPPHGGPETIDCTRDSCSTYTISDGKLKLSNGKSFAITTSDKGELVINDVTLSPVFPVADGFKLQGTYKYIGYSGLVGVNAASSSWTEYLTFAKDGTFKSTDLTLSSLDVISSATNSAGSKSDKGTYSISGNTIVLTYGDGTVVTRLFFNHSDAGVENPKKIQVGSDRFYIPDDK